MASPTAGVITFPGSNCDYDLVHVLRAQLGVSVRQLWHKDTELQGVDVVFVPGGFSYGDYLRTGAIARFSPIMQAVAAHAQRGGRVVGICNGFQILCEANLLPGILRINESGQFISKTVNIQPATTSHAFTQGLEARPYRIPIAHKEGNYFADAETVSRLEDNGQVLFRYVDASGEPSLAANPNGSVRNIAGVANAAGNVMGMMPHPERAADPRLGNTDGKPILAALMAMQPAGA
jgi:phosphoribosylformylglycinamidine synthase